MTLIRDQAANEEVSLDGTQLMYGIFWINIVDAIPDYDRKANPDLQEAANVPIQPSLSCLGSWICLKLVYFGTT